MEERNVYYTNSIEIETTAFDVKLKINYNTSEEGKIQSKRLCEITMSPQHAKAFSNILKNVMNDYEENFGRINLEGIKDGQNE